MGKKIAIGCAGAALVFLLIVGVSIGGTYNSLVQLDQATQAQWAQVQNTYQRRADLVPNLVATVKGAANFEQSTMTAVTEARARVGQVTPAAMADITKDPAAFQRYQQAQQGLSSALSRLLVVAENYPQLKATANFRDLQAQLEGTENRITVERQRFNEAAQAFNTRRSSFPTVMIAGFFGDKFATKRLLPGTIRKRKSARGEVLTCFCAVMCLSLASWFRPRSYTRLKRPSPPSPTEWVTDTANFLSPEAVRSLNARLAAYEQATGHQLIVYIAPTTGDAPIEDWAVRAFAKWKVGRKGLDDGLAVFIMTQDHKMRIEVGYGLEAVVPDAIASRVINEVMAPRIQAGHPDDAVAAAIDALTGVIGGQAGAPPPRGRRRSPGR